MRGFSIFFIVYIHILQFSFGLIKEGVSVSYLTMILNSNNLGLPIFFFISGYLGYFDNKNFSLSKYKSLLKKKFLTLIVPTLFISSIFCIVKGLTVFPTIYWFAIALFAMFSLYYSVSFVRNKKIFDWVYVLAVILVFCVYLYGLAKGFMRDSELASIFYFGVPNLPFFVLGNFFMKYKRFGERIITNEYFILSAILLYVLTFIAFKVLLIPGFPLDETIQRFSLGLSSLIIVYVSFRKYKNVFTKETWIGRNLQNIGSKTLDIYFLHYFFIMPLPALKNFIVENPSSIIEFIITASLTVCIIFLCFIFSKVLSTSTILERYLFGRKINIK